MTYRPAPCRCGPRCTREDDALRAAQYADVILGRTALPTADLEDEMTDTTTTPGITTAELIADWPQCAETARTALREAGYGVTMAEAAEAWEIVAAAWADDLL